MHACSMSTLACAAIVCAGLLLRAAVSVNSHSGEGKPPMYGDYEAQRHWMEITINTPIAEWYVNTTDNDLQYWGLDYPPLTAIHSWICGQFAAAFEPASMYLGDSRGYATPSFKAFMRTTVLAADAAIFVPGAVWAASVLHATRSSSERIGALSALLVQPTLILIDHGHFQYNCVALGLALLALGCLVSRRDLLAAVFFCAALNYKQISLYYALPVFCFMLGRALARPLVPCLTYLALVGGVVVMSFTLFWLPFLSSENDWALPRQVVHRLFPFERGLFEDKVASFWCAIEPLARLKQAMPLDRLKPLTTLVTLVAVAPACVDLLVRRSPLRLLHALFASALGFFLFAFQAHEKSILFAVLPAALLLPTYPFAARWFLDVALFSLFPLLKKDGLALAWLACAVLAAIVLRLVPPLGMPHVHDPIYRTLAVGRTATSWLGAIVQSVSYASMAGALIADVALEPPAHLPFLWPYAIAAIAAAHFVLFLLGATFFQLTRLTALERRPPAAARNAQHARAPPKAVKTD